MACIGDLRGQLLLQNNEKVDAFRKQLNDIMRAKGWVRDARTASALYDISYWQADKVPGRYQGQGIRRLTINGWHGTGAPGTCRHFGDTKTFFALYDSGAPGYKPVVNAERGILGGVELSLDELLREQDTAMAAALEYARKV